MVAFCLLKCSELTVWKWWYTIGRHYVRRNFGVARVSQARHDNNYIQFSEEWSSSNNLVRGGARGAEGLGHQSHHTHLTLHLVAGAKLAHRPEGGRGSCHWFHFSSSSCLWSVRQFLSTCPQALAPRHRRAPAWGQLTPRRWRHSKIVLGPWVS